MVSKPRIYAGQGIDVAYDVKRCIHAEQCVRHLRAVFDPDQRPWIQPERADADTIATTIERCPTGALHYQRTDGGAAEAVPAENTIRIDPNGPLYVQGDLILQTSDGTEVMRETRLALCRCGASKNKPFCDNAHIETGFADPGMPAARDPQDTTEASSQLVIKPTLNGSVLIEGRFKLLNAEGEVVFTGAKTWLCRCGGSANKPFCDSTHKNNGFQAE